MKIKNTSLIYETKLLMEVVKFVKPTKISNFNIHLKNSGDNRCRGRAYYNGCSYGDSVGALIVARIGKFNKFPYRYKPRKNTGYLPCTIYTQEELLVHLLAHELRHLWQVKVKRGWRVWGARGRFSERDCDAYAIRKVREWRRK